MSTEKIVAAAGSAFHVVDTGETDLVPVVCLHSLFLDNRQFEGFTEAARGRYRVIRPDFRGQGRSAPADRDVITMERNAGEMAAVVDALGITHAHFVVSSMGGDVGARVAAYRPDLLLPIVPAFLDRDGTINVERARIQKDNNDRLATIRDLDTQLQNMRKQLEDPSIAEVYSRDRDVT